MSRLPDRFDLWVRRAKSFSDPERQLDFVLGALVTLPDWYFLNVGTAENPQPAVGEFDSARSLVVFSDAGRIMEVAEQMELPKPETHAMAIPSAKALVWCVDEKPGRCEALLVNPGEDAALIPLARVADFAREWQARDALQASGFWIPNLTGEEEEFWQEHGL
jgi:hypothetical protein